MRLRVGAAPCDGLMAEAGELLNWATEDELLTLEAATAPDAPDLPAEAELLRLLLALAERRDRGERP